MNKYDFNNVADYNNVGSVKNHATLIKNFFGLNYYEDSISLWVSEMDFKMAPEISEAIIERVQKGVLGYSGLTKEYYKSVIHWLDYKHNTTIRKDWIIPSAGTLHGLRNALRAFTSEGDKVIIQTPVYGQFAMQIESTKRIIANNPLIKEEDYQIDFEGFEELAKQEDVKMFILCNPHNPTGNVWNQEDVIKLLEISKANDVVVFADEVHGEIVREGVEFVSTASMGYDHVITAFGLGKAFNLTGMHITNLIIKGKELRDTFTAYTGFSSASPITLAAVVAAYNDGKEWLSEVNSVIDSNVQFIEDYIKENMPLVKYRKPEGTYLVWFDFSAYDVPTKELTEMMADGKILMESGLAFGEEGNGFIRMMSATPRPRLEEALHRIKGVLESIKG